MTAFVEGLVQRGHDVVVVCEQPNHPAGVFADGYGRRPLAVEVGKNVKVYRVWVAASPVKTTVRRMAFYGSFALWSGVLPMLIRHADVVFATSPPLPGAITAGASTWLRGKPFVLDVRDLWPAAASALGELTDPRLIAFFERAESWLYHRAAFVTATTRPFCEHIDAIVGKSKAVHLPNGALDSLLDLPANGPPQSDAAFKVGYAGNFGIAQGLRIVLDAADRLQGHPVRFVLVGSGPVRAELEADIERRELRNVELLPPVGVQEVGRFLASCHAILVPLRDHPVLQDFIPSKLYDAMAVGRPVLVAAAGEPARLVAESGCGIGVAPENGEQLADAIKRLRADPGLAEKLGQFGRAAAESMRRSEQVARLESILFEATADRYVRSQRRP